MPIHIWPVVIENIIWFSGLSLYQRYMLRNTGVFHGVIWNALPHVHEGSSLTHGLRWYLLSIRPWPFPYHEVKDVSLKSRIRMELVRWIGALSSITSCLVVAGYLSIHPGRCPRHTPNHRRRRHMLTHKHPNWDHKHCAICWWVHSQPLQL